MGAILRTLEIGRTGFSGRSANFIVFPEYSVPGVRGAALINARISAADWPNESIVIAGLDGISKDQYGELCESMAAHVSRVDAPDSVQGNRWINCCVIWVKDRRGVIQKWVQLKVHPAWLEMKVTCEDLFCGSSVFAFECQYYPSGVPCRFITLICFDWIAYVDGITVFDEVLSKLTELNRPRLTQLDWIFVLQHNDSPNHPAFLNSTYRFLTDTNSYPFVERDKAVIVHANTAASPYPTRNGPGGFSSCVFSPSAQFDCNLCRPSVSMQPSGLRGSEILGRCKDVVFREMGECVHAFTVRAPRFVTPDPRDRTFPLPMADVHATGDSTDPRLTGGPIPASVKWLNDSLDQIERVSTSALSGCPLAARAETIETDVIAKMRTSDGYTASDSVNWTTCCFSHGIESRKIDRRLNADFWTTDETSGLVHLLHSLTSLGLAYDLDFESALLHVAVHDHEQVVQVVAVSGETHEDCRLHYDKHIPHQGSDPVLVIARDRHNLIPTREEYLRFYEVDGVNTLAFLDYQTLINHCRTAPDGGTLRGHLDDILPRNRRII
jgi:hypothetical protein